MKKTKFKTLTLLMWGVLVSIWLITPVMATTPEQCEPESIVQWMKALPEQTQAQVIGVFKQNMALAEDNGLKGTDSSHTIARLTQLTEAIYRDLQVILTPEQLEQFFRLNKTMSKTPEMDVSRTFDSCSSCYIVKYSLTTAKNYLDIANNLYDPETYNCTMPAPGMPDPIATMINASKIFTQWARDEASDAYDFCDCESAEDALSDAQTALGYLNSAISGTISKCDPNPPWLEWLEAAKDWLEYAISNLPACIAQACG